MNRQRPTQLVPLALLALLPMFTKTATAATVNASSCSQSSVATAISSAANGDVVQVPAGTCSWSGLSIAKPIHLKGAGVGQTNITVAGNYGDQTVWRHHSHHQLLIFEVGWR